MVHDTILGLSGYWNVIFFGERSSAGGADEVLAPGVNWMQILPRCQPDAGSPFCVEASSGSQRDAGSPK